MEQPNKIVLRKYIINIVIFSLCCSAVVGIIGFLMGDFGVTFWKLLLTTISLGYFSLLSITGAIQAERNRYPTFGYTTAIVAAITLFFTVIILWFTDIFTSVTLLKLYWSLFVISFALAHSSLVFQINMKKDKIIEYLSIATISCIGIFTFMLVLLIMSEFKASSDFYFRLLGVFGILTVLGSVVLPLMYRSKYPLNSHKVAQENITKPE